MDIINTETGIKIYPIESDEDIYKAFFCKITAIYGLTGSGKSFLINTILQSLAGVIPRFITYSATEAVNHNYTNMSCSPTVFSTFDPGLIKKNMEFQEGIMNYWKQGNELETLEPIFQRVASSADKIKAESYIKQLDQLPIDTETDKKRIEISKVEIYKSFIRTAHLSNKDDITVKKWMDINPCFCYLIDDFAAEMSTATKSKNAYQEFFRSQSFNIRHYFSTAFILLQDLNALDPRMRTNIQTNIFTSMSEARGFFKNSTNNFSKEVFKDANSVCDKLEKMGGYRALVYCRSTTNNHLWYYMIGKSDAKPVLQCKPLRVLCEQVKDDSKKNANTTNAFADELA